MASGDSSGEEYSQFQEIYRSYFAKIRAYFLNSGFAEDDSDDFTQEVFLRAYRGFGNFRSESAPQTWLYRIARNVHLNYLRDEEANRLKIALSTSDWPEEAHQGATLSTGELRLLIAEVGTAFADLPKQMRLNLDLRVRGLEYKEISDLLDLSIQSVKTHIHEARKRLRSAIESDGLLSRKKHEQPKHATSQFGAVSWLVQEFVENEDSAVASITFAYQTNLGHRESEWSQLDTEHRKRLGAAIKALARQVAKEIENSERQISWLRLIPQERARALEADHFIVSMRKALVAEGPEDNIDYFLRLKAFARALGELDLRSKILPMSNFGKFYETCQTALDLVTKTFGTADRWARINAILWGAMAKQSEPQLTLIEVEEIALLAEVDSAQVLAVLALLSRSPGGPLRMGYFLEIQGRKTLIPKSEVAGWLKAWWRDKIITEDQWRLWASRLVVSWTPVAQNEEAA